MCCSHSKQGPLHFLLISDCCNLKKSVYINSLILIYTVCPFILYMQLIIRTYTWFSFWQIINWGPTERGQRQCVLCLLSVLFHQSGRHTALHTAVGQLYLLLCFHLRSGFTNLNKEIRQQSYWKTPMKLLILNYNPKVVLQS